MTGNAILQLTLYVVVLIALAKPLGAYMAAIYEGRAPVLGRLLGPVERLIYRVCGVKPDDEQRWTQYALAMVSPEKGAGAKLVLRNASRFDGNVNPITAENGPCAHNGPSARKALRCPDGR